MIESLHGQAGSTTIMGMPDYQRVADAIIGRIRSGELRPGDRLESISQLAELLGASKTTIKTAQLALRSQGWIVGQQGKAVYVAANPPIDQVPGDGQD